MQFVEDTILFLPEDKESFLSILSLLLIFELVSRLCVNLSKSGLGGINVQEWVVYEIVELSGCGVLHWPLTYLGIPLGGNPHAESFWVLVVQRISKKLGS